MVRKHLTDEEIQLFTFDKVNAGSAIAEHIHVCSECKTKAEAYQLLMRGIREQPQRAFDFDLSAAVLERLPTPVPGATSDRLLTWVFIIICTGLVGTVSYFFRGYMESIFKGIAGISVFLMAVSAFTIITVLFVEMYKKYQKEMNVLDLY